MREEFAILAGHGLHSSSRVRIARQLWWELRRAGPRGARLTEAYIAARAGTTQQRVSSEFRRFIAAGIMLRDPRTHRLIPLNLDRLLDVTERHAEPVRPRPPAST